MENYNEPIIDLITKFTLNGMKALQTSSPTSCKFFKNILNK